MNARVLAAAWVLAAFLTGVPAAAAEESETEALARARAANQARDFATSLAIYRQWSERGSAPASTALGLMYWSGTGVTRDRRQACDLFEAAEQRSDPNGTEALADCYFHGDGRAQDYGRSAQLYTRAAARGVVQGDCALGNQYLLGLGVAKDPTRALALCRRAAERGSADAAADLGQMYLTGSAAGRDPQEAARWFQQAVAGGQANGNAAVLLGNMRWNGDGVERDHEAAASAWLIAAQHHNPLAAGLLAKYYFTRSLAPEKQIRVDPATKAVYWATLATRTDPDPAVRQDSQKLLDMLLGAAPALRARADELLTQPALPGL